MSHAPSLGLDPRLVGALARAYAGYGRVLHAGAVKDELPWEATSFLFAADLYAIERDAEAPGAFHRAAEAYRNTRKSYWKVAAVCALVRDIPVIVPASDQPVPDDVFHDLLAESWNAAQGSHQRPVLDWLRGPRGQRLNAFAVGRHRLPLSLYVEATAEIANPFPGAGLGTLRQILFRTWENTARAQIDTFHWKGLTGGELPVEPEIIALCLPLAALGLTGQALLSRLELPEPIGAALEIAFELAGHVRH